MSTNAPLAAPARTHQRTRTTPASAGLPDPRPLTGYTAVYDVDKGVSRITVTLDAPCIIRGPKWMFIDCADGSHLAPQEIVVVDNVTIVFRFSGIIPASVAFIDVPYQDMQVQNFHGGFVKPGGQWFRNPG